ncbi:sodium:solute symporter family transporter [Nonomuraea sp. H19]|uniref:sodium:solute symporter family transporter n=1 Tax=Nonomuraea sp. H19 TaxID=3452206 RepID=UPI003F8B85B9
MRLDVNVLDYVLIAIYFVTVLAIGLAARRRIVSSLDFFLAGRGLPAWITGLAFVSANLGAIEILGMAANGAQYGAMTVHYYWIGAVPAMVFLGIVICRTTTARRSAACPSSCAGASTGPRSC